MIHPKCIVPECEADTFFIELIRTLHPDGPNHKHGKTKVFKALNEELKDNIALAIIDKDPHAKIKNDFSEYKLIDSDDRDFLKLYKHKKRNHHIIEVNKEFEYWLFNELNQEANINLSHYGIPDSYKEFSNYFKTTDIRSQQNVRAYFKKLIGSQSTSLKLYIKWLNKIISQN